MPLENTGIMIGERHSALIVSPASAYLVSAQCTNGCPTSFWVAGATWTDDVDVATIFRSYEAGEIAMGEAKEKVRGCLSVKGVIFDVKPLAGFVK